MSPTNIWLFFIMPTLKANNIDLFYRSIGDGPETIVFSHGYLMNNTMYNDQIAVLKDKYRCVTFDHRGHGKSEVTASGYALEDLVDDAIAFVEGLGSGPVHFVGMSTGGFVGMRIALRRPEVLKSLVLMNTSASKEPAAAKKKYDLLIWMVKTFGWGPVIGTAIKTMFHSTFLKDRSRKEQVKEWKNIVKSHNKGAVIKFGQGIFSRDDVLDRLSALEIPCAVIIGEFDAATPPKLGRKIADKIPGAKLYEIKDAGHSTPIEKPQEVNKALRDFYGI